mmetsp:Transcript_27635/g.80083  ORF Transcript_27635/g.80083 Transcript_27635/m.80083 type:complete len:204 (+) Transcript_27635:187-798(+)
MRAPAAAAAVGRPCRGPGARRGGFRAARLAHLPAASRESLPGAYVHHRERRACRRGRGLPGGARLPRLGAGAGARLPAGGFAGVRQRWAGLAIRHGLGPPPFLRRRLRDAVVAGRRCCGGREVPWTRVLALRGLREPPCPARGPGLPRLRRGLPRGGRREACGTIESRRAPARASAAGCRRGWWCRRAADAQRIRTRCRRSCP